MIFCLSSASFYVSELENEIVGVTKTPPRCAYNHLILMNLHNLKVVRIIGWFISCWVWDMIFFWLSNLKPKVILTHTNVLGIHFQFLFKVQFFSSHKKWKKTLIPLRSNFCVFSGKSTFSLKQRKKKQITFLFVEENPYTWLKFFDFLTNRKSFRHKVQHTEKKWWFSFAH